MNIYHIDIHRTYVVIEASDMSHPNITIYRSGVLPDQDSHCRVEMRRLPGFTVQIQLKEFLEWLNTNFFNQPEPNDPEWDNLPY